MSESEIQIDAISRHVMVLESPKGLETMDLTRRLREMGAPVLIAASFEEAEELLRNGDEDIGAMMIPTTYEPKQLKKSLKALLSMGPPGCVNLISVGDPPADADRKKIRKAGVKLALWNPITEPNMRFQINRALHQGREGFGSRNNPRIPSQFGCTVSIGDRHKDASIYSLAETGAFLVTQRASMKGSEVELKLRSPGGPIETTAQVVYANVPGNLQRPGLPLGMGVHFHELEQDDQKRLRNLITDSIAELEV
jgi:hypothetical protein